jgi:hypothetical protein
MDFTHCKDYWFSLSFINLYCLVACCLLKETVVHLMITRFDYCTLFDSKKEERFDYGEEEVSC